MRPPYAIPEQQFLSRCDGCGDCREACETQVIGEDADGFPVLLFGQAACSFCENCAAACPTGAMSLDRARAWTAAAHISASCLSFNGVTCRACEESCDAGAISFRLMTEGRSLPLIDADRCTGCGACAVCCPNDSIDIRSASLEEVYA